MQIGRTVNFPPRQGPGASPWASASPKARKAEGRGQSPFRACLSERGNRPAPHLGAGRENRQLSPEARPGASPWASASPKPRKAEGRGKSRSKAALSERGNCPVLLGSRAGEPSTFPRGRARGQSLGQRLPKGPEGRGQGGSLVLGLSRQPRRNLPLPGPPGRTKPVIRHSTWVNTCLAGGV